MLPHVLEFVVRGGYATVSEIVAYLKWTGFRVDGDDTLGLACAERGNIVLWNNTSRQLCERVPTRFVPKLTARVAESRGVSSDAPPTAIRHVADEARARRTTTAGLGPSMRRRAGRLLGR